uniref:Uncharacterized protein n=1 Tax=Anguilla anguilla TaxID=7936 RepID=A0A0E9W927_ANGAN
MFFVFLFCFYYTVLKTTTKKKEKKCGAFTFSPRNSF